MKRRCIAKLLIRPYRARITETDHRDNTHAMGHNAPLSTVSVSGGCCQRGYAALGCEMLGARYMILTRHSWAHIHCFHLDSIACFARCHSRIDRYGTL